MKRRRLKWCDLCRDNDPDEICVGEGCKKAFHKDCILISSATDGYVNGEYYCNDCYDDTFAERKSHDDKCTICKKKENHGTAGKGFVLCQACPKAFHLNCVGLTREPDEDWKCQTCNPEMNTVQVRLKGVNRQKIGNVQICYVCQHGGRLLGCAKCPQSYHPKCIDSTILRNIEHNDNWECPLCLGIDPLRHIQHKRLDATQRKERCAKRQAKITKLKTESKVNRDIFLWSQRQALMPFVSAKIMDRLMRNSHKVSRHKSKVSYDQIDVSVLDNLEAKCASNNQYTLLNDGVKLKPYQVYGVCWMLNAFEHKAGAILADEMGLGKTIQTLAFLSALKAKGIEGPHLIVVPLSTVGNWVREIQRFTSHISFTKICGSKAERAHAMAEPVSREGCVDVYITTYETASTEEWFFADHFEWATLILDEAHRIKSEKGAVRHSLDRIGTAFRVLLTGTPLQNNVKELHTLLNFLFPDILTEAEEFEKAFQTGGGHVTYGGGFNKKKSAKDMKIAKAEQDTKLDFDENRLQAVCKLLKLLMLRRTKVEVVDLPNKIEHEIWLPLSPLQIKLYRGLIDLSEGDIMEGKIRKMLGTMIKMRLTSSHPASALKSHETQNSRVQTAKEKLLLAHEYSGYYSNVIGHKEFSDLLNNIESLEGERHISASSKLIFVDKLLSHLHSYNMNISTTYRESYTRTVVDSKAQGSVGVPNLDLEAITDVNDPFTSINAMGEEKLTISTGKVPIPYEEEDLPLFVDASYPWISSASQKTWADAYAYKKDYERLRLGSNSVSEHHSSSVEEFDAPSGNTPVPPPVSKKPIPHRVLIFSQFRLVLNELERYCKFRGFQYLRLDGATNKMIRELDIREFNDESSTYFVYLIGTRAGGMGINLVTANHVILYDEDWNPFVDMQAIDRAHRIGQKRQVHVWKLTSEWTVEERMAFRRAQKMKLDSKLIRARTEKAEMEMNSSMDSHEKLAIDDVRKLLVYGSEAIRWLSTKVPDENLTSWSVNKFLQRERCTMPDDINIEEFQPEDFVEHEGNEEGIEVVTDDTEGDEGGVIPASTQLGSSSGPAEDTPEDVAIVGDTTQNRRGTRVRKPTTLIYNPVLYKETKAKIPLRHEDRCFICQDKEFKKTLTVRTDGKDIDTTEDNPSDEASFIKCNTCPKVYHVGQCLGLPSVMKERRNYKCQWHECSICYRKSSQAGGLLIHCAACPTSFCFDCFPPEYRRYWPNPMYYDNLMTRGFTTSPANFITYLCSRCKAMEQQKRRSLLDTETLKQELANEKAEQIRLKEEEKKLKEAQKQEREDKAKAKIEEKERRKQLREEKEAEKRAVQRDKERRANEVQQYNELSKRLTESIEALFPEGSADMFDQMLHSLRWMPGNGVLQKNRDAKIRSELLQGVKGTVKVCTNCSMPLHKALECPWPPETRKLSHYLSIDRVILNEKGVPSIPTDTPGASLFEGINWKIRQSDNVIEIDLNTAPVVPEDMKGVEVYKKRMTKQFCSSCGVRGTEHTRRQCPILDDVEKESYESHKHLLGTLVLNIELYQDQFKSRLPPTPTISGIKELIADIPKEGSLPKDHPNISILSEKAVELTRWRTELVSMIGDFVTLVSNAINLQHINCTNPEFVPFPDPIFNEIESVSRAEKAAVYNRGKKRSKPEVDQISQPSMKPISGSETATREEQLSLKDVFEGNKRPKIGEITPMTFTDIDPATDTLSPLQTSEALSCGPNTDKIMFGTTDSIVDEL